MNNKDISKDISKQYVKLSHIEHILKRPDTYIGSVTTEKRSVYAIDDIDDFITPKISYKTLDYNPGFIKMFDETITNASDYAVETGKVTYIKVDINDDCISVENDGPGIPVIQHDTEKVYIGEMIFGNLLTGTNFADDKERFGGGRNGLGIKLVNIYSTKFVVETADGKHKYHQIFKNNLSIIDKPTITKSKNNYVKVTYYPDYDKFGMSGMTNDIKSVLVRRIFDIAAYNPIVKVSYNGNVIPVRNFKDYMKLFADEDSVYYERIDDFWEVGVIKSPVDAFTHMSMVNGISTIVGGSHVNHVSNYLANNIRDNILRGNKGINIKPIDVKNRMLLFINCKIANPVFDTQTKENLKSKLNANIKDFAISDAFIKKVSKDEMFLDLVELSLLREQMEAKKELNKQASKRLKVNKLVDANKAGTSESNKCYLMLTEGDSALSFAITGFAETGRDYYGAYPLRGKPLNTRQVAMSKIKNNDEIKNIIQILGLEFGKKYTDTKSLRYGKVIILSDNDLDGYHIRGLLLNLIDCFWPELLKLDFLYEFLTPILRVKSGNKQKFFYRINDYDKWMAENDNGKGYSTKYFKGLGSSVPVDIKNFFKNIDKHLIKFNYTDEKQTEDIIDLAFNKNREDERKAWLLNYKPNRVIDKFAQKTTYLSFMNDEFIEYSMADNIRSIPAMMDGLKPSQRKILYTMFKLNTTEEINVGELFGFVKAYANYHHAPQSLEQGIINMAQNYIGSNNISFLEPIGGFGTRLSGGHDASAARYIHTRLSSITNKVFIKEDNDIIDYLNVDGKLVEPVYYIPIIPTVLLNGCEGIGTGWSTYIPKFRLDDLVDYIDNKLSNKRKNIDLIPYYEGFKGSIVYDDATKCYVTSGIINKLNSTTLNVVELPVGVWNNTYYNLLDELIDDKVIKSYTKDCTDVNVNIKIKIAKESLELLSDDDLIRIFELTSKIRISNMHLFDINGKIKKYETQYEIIDDYYNNRLAFYDKRKLFLVERLENKKNYYDNTIKFLTLVVNKKIIINNKPMSEIVESLVKNKIDMVDGSYDYLLNIPIYKFTMEQLDKLNTDYTKLVAELSSIRNTSTEQMWKNDLQALRKEYKKFTK